MKIRLLSLALLFALLLSSCGSDDDGGGETLTVGVDFAEVFDSENHGDASDIFIAFNPSENENLISAYRIIVVKNSATAGFDAITASNLSSDRFFNISPAGRRIETFLTAGLNDSDGDAIVEDIAYRVYVLTVATIDQTETFDLFGIGTPITLATTDILETIVELPIGTGGLIVDAEGNIYCADFGRSLSGPPGTRLYKITPEGVASVFATGFVGASGNTIGPDGHIYQSNISGGTISRVTPEGNVSSFATGLSGPVGLIFDREGFLYSANCSDNTIKRIDSEGNVTVFASGTMFSCPNGITIDNSGNLYVANFSNDNVIKITPEGETSVFASQPGNNNGHITFFNNRLYVVARAAHQIYEFDLQGNGRPIVGSGNRGHRDGAALQGRLSLPNDLGFSPDGRFLYINDSKPLTGTPANSDIQPTMLKRVRLEQD